MLFTHCQLYIPDTEISLASETMEKRGAEASRLLNIKYQSKVVQTAHHFVFNILLFFKQNT